jgi:hypothetical protein
MGVPLYTVGALLKMKTKINSKHFNCFLQNGTINKFNLKITEENDVLASFFTH